MIQLQMMQAGVQVEAAREIGKLFRPLDQRVVRMVRGVIRRRSQNQPDAATQDAPEEPFGHLTVRLAPFAETQSIE